MERKKENQELSLKNNKRHIPARRNLTKGVRVEGPSLTEKKLQGYND